MKKLAANVALLLATTLLCLLVFEVAVRSLDLMEPARWAAFARGGEREVGDAETGAPSGDKSVSRWMIHPYRGITERPGGRRDHWKHDVRNNALGVVDPIEDPRLLTEQDLVVAVFGGSVARATALTGGNALARGLEKTGWPGEHEVRVVNFAISGYKQPQQLFLLSEAMLLGVPFDVVINLDGFNEVALGATDAKKGHHPLLPHDAFWTAAFGAATGRLSLEQIELTAAALEQRRRVQEIREDFAQSPLRRSALFQAFMGANAKRAEAAAVRLEEQMRAADGDSELDLFSLDDPCLGKDSTCWDLILGLWQRSSLSMHALVESQGGVYFHALQPNQYLEGSKSLNKAELETAWDPERPWSQAAVTAYPMLREAGRELEVEGIRWLDMTQVFADTSETIYRDVCCHYNTRGYRVLAEQIGRAVGERLLAEGLPPDVAEPRESAVDPL